MEKDINFYRECLKRELKKPFNRQDFMYMRFLDEKIYKLKEKELIKLENKSLVFQDEPYFALSDKFFKKHANRLRAPDGHLKIPHLWPGQNPPPEARSYPIGERAD